MWPPLRLPVAVFQPLPGIGDMVWHLPHIRAIASHAGAPVTVLTKPRSLADQLLRHESAVREVLWVDRNPSSERGAHDGPLGLLRLVRMLRRHRFGSAILLHHGDTLAAAAWLAGIADRRGYGRGTQRWFLNSGPWLSAEDARLRPHGRATAYLRAAGVLSSSAEPALFIPPADRAAARERLGGTTEPFVAIGIGSSEDLRRWPAERFTALVAALLHAGWPLVVLLGGPEDQAAATAIQSAVAAGPDRVRLAMGWPLDQVAGLLAAASFYVGNDTGVMNMSAAAGIRSYGIFGRTPPVEHASQIVAITTPDIGVYDGIARVGPDQVLEAIRADRGSLRPA